MTTKLIQAMLLSAIMSLGSVLAQTPSNSRIYKTASPTQQKTQAVRNFQVTKSKVNKFLPNTVSKRLFDMNKETKSVFIAFDKVHSQNYIQRVNQEETLFFIAGKHVSTSFENKAVSKTLATIHKRQKKQANIESRLYNIRFAPLNTQIETRIFFKIGERALSSYKVLQIQEILNSTKEAINRYRHNHPNSFVKVMIDLEGYSDKVGRESSVEKRKMKNKALSQQRAEEIGEYMKKTLYEGDFVQRIELSTEGKGEVLPPGCVDGEVNDPSRRICLIKIKVTSY